MIECVRAALLFALLAAAGNNLLLKTLRGCWCYRLVAGGWLLLLLRRPNINAPAAHAQNVHEMRVAHSIWTLLLLLLLYNKLGKIIRLLINN